MKKAATKARAKRGSRGPTVQSYVSALPDWQRTIARRFDRLVMRRVRNARRVIKWGLPFYGVAGRGWFVSCGGFPTCVKITFFQGASLEPLPPTGKGRQLRGIDLHRGDRFDERTIASWVKQAAALPGFGK